MHWGGQGWGCGVMGASLPGGVYDCTFQCADLFIKSQYRWRSSRPTSLGYTRR